MTGLDDGGLVFPGTRTEKINMGPDFPAASLEVDYPGLSVFDLVTIVAMHALIESKTPPLHRENIMVEARQFAITFLEMKEKSK